MPADPSARPGEGEGQSADLFDVAAIKDYAGFVLRGVRRHRLLAACTFILAATVCVSGALVYPKTYHVQTKILAQRNQVLASLGNPRRSVPFDADAPTRAARETVLRRDNLVSLVRQTNLVDRWASTRTPLFRLKDTIMDFVRGPLTEDEKLDSMVGMLEKKIQVSIDTTSVTIAIQFRDPQLAYQLIEAAQRNFLETQHVAEVSTISEAISILEVHASQAHDAVDAALSEVVSTRDARRGGGKAVAPASAAVQVVSRPRVAPLVNDAELTQLRFLIRAKRRAVQDLEAFRSRRLSELNAQLAEQKVQYSDQHPVVQETQQRIAAMQVESPQVAALKHDEQELLADYTKAGGTDPMALVEPTPPRTLRRLETSLQAPDLAPIDDPEVAFSEGQLRTAQARYDDLVMRIDGARIELDTARAAFKYRYSVLNPAQLPKEPIKPNVPLLLLTGLALSAVAGLLVGAARDLWRGRIVEAWQIERGLGLEVLAEVGRK